MGDTTRPSDPMDLEMYSVAEGIPRLDASLRASGSGARTVGDLADVIAVPVPELRSRIQYWTFTDIEMVGHDADMSERPLVYDLTFLAPEPVGWERSKTHGHVHVGPGGAEFPELYEVLEGRAGFLVQDLIPGPSSSFAVLIEANVGDSVVIPPSLHHATVNLGSTMVVAGDVVARQAQDDYSLIKAAHGMSYYLGVDGRARPNPKYRDVPTLERIPAKVWSDAPRGPLMTRLAKDAPAFGWLRDPGGFTRRFPELRRQVDRVVRRT